MIRKLIFAALLGSILPLQASADRGDPEQGRVLSDTCTGCHGIPFHQNVFPTYTVPRIGGQTEGYIVAALRAYRTGERQHPTMRAQANTLTDQDILDIAAYLSQLGGREQ